MTTPDVDRRLTEVERRIEFIDQHGSRGIDGLRLQLSVIDRDMGKMQGVLSKLDDTVGKLRPQRTWPTVTAYIVTVIPLYALVISLLVNK